MSNSASEANQLGTTALLLIFFFAFLYPPVKDLVYKSPLIGLYTPDPLHRLSKTPMRTFPNSSVSCSNLLHEHRVSAGLQEFSKAGFLSETGPPLKHTDRLVGLRAGGELPSELASSTRMISLRSRAEEVCRTL